MTTNAALNADTLLDGQVLFLKLFDSTRPTIDEFVRMIYEDGQQRTRRGEKKHYSLYDFSDTLAAVTTPYGRSKLKEMMRWKLCERAYIAVILPDTVIMQISRILVNSLVREDRHIRLCVTLPEAVEWLQAMIDQES